MIIDKGGDDGDDDDDDGDHDDDDDDSDDGDDDGGNGDHDHDDDDHLLHSVVVVVLQFAHEVPSRRADDWKFTFEFENVKRRAVKFILSQCVDEWKNAILRLKEI